MIDTPDEEECYGLLSAATVGRVGFQREGRIEIIPVNYILHERDIIFRTREDGILSDLPGQQGVAFEVDYHEGLTGSAWSVLLSGDVQALAHEVAEAIPGVDRVQPWVGGERTRWMRFIPSRITGRLVQRRRNI